MSEENSNQLAVQPQKSPVALGQGGIRFNSTEELFRFAKAVAGTAFAPKDFRDPEAVFVAMSAGMEMGLRPMQSLASIAVINGRPGIYGDAALALVRSSGLLESYQQKVTDDEAIVTVKRVGDAFPVIGSFTLAEAKQAGLLGKQGPWTQYPKRMLMFRARGFALRDAFGDVLRGMRTTEELEDIPEAKVIETSRPEFPPENEEQKRKPRAAKVAAAPAPQTQAETVYEARETATSTAQDKPAETAPVEVVKPEPAATPAAKPSADYKKLVIDECRTKGFDETQLRLFLIGRDLMQPDETLDDVTPASWRQWYGDMPNMIKMMRADMAPKP